MRVLVVEDEDVLLERLTGLLHEALPAAELLAFDNAGDALAVLPEKEADIAFLDTAVGDMNGIDLAKSVRKLYPDCDIVFCAECGDYAVQAFELGASDYLMKPVSKAKIAHALSLLRRNNAYHTMAQGLYIRCFGEFEVFYRGEPVASFTKRSKELLAYLVDKAGAICTSADISNTIFHGSSDSYFRVAKRDLIQILSGIGQEDILINGWGKLGLNREKVCCDYFDYLDGKPQAQNRYKGAYMLQYPWAQAQSFHFHT